MKPTICFLTDTCEQQPLTFGPPLRTVALNDQAPLSIRLERKTLGDLYGSIGAGPISDAHHPLLACR